MVKANVTLALLLALSACGEDSRAPAIESKDSGIPITASDIEPLSDGDLLRVCRGGASFRNGTKVASIRAKKNAENLVRLSYTREDGKFFAYDCMTEGNQVRFRMIDEAGPGSGPGMWSGRGSRTTFRLLQGEIEFTDDFFDGSTDTDRIRI